jgi:hypothetical protein
MIQRTERGYGIHLASHDMHNPVYIMTGFCQKHGTADIFPPPVSAYIGMNVMPVSYRFKPLERDNFSYPA